MNNSIFELKNVYKHFCISGVEYSILDDISFKLNSNETVSIIGASGVGKTTLINLISMLEPSDSGEIFWNQKCVTKMSFSEICKLRGKMFGFIFQNYNLINELNVLENIILPIKINSSIKSFDLKFAETLLEKVELLERKFSRIDILSGGEKQRIAIVRAIINRPKIILADEPTGNLDESNSYKVINLMLELCRENHTSMLLITHNNNLAKLLDRQYLLSNGHLVQQRKE